MIQFPIFHETESIGVLSAKQDGLYWCFQADCHFRAGLWRLYAVRAGELLCNLGVLQPCGGRMRLARRISCRALALDEQMVFTLTPQYAAEKVGIPFCPEKPFDDMAHFCLYRVEKTGGGYVWIK